MQGIKKSMESTTLLHLKGRFGWANEMFELAVSKCGIIVGLLMTKLKKAQKQGTVQAMTTHCIQKQELKLIRIFDTINSKSYIE